MTTTKKQQPDTPAASGPLKTQKIYLDNGAEVHIRFRQGDGTKFLFSQSGVSVSTGADLQPPAHTGSHPSAPVDPAPGRRSQEPNAETKRLIAEERKKNAEKKNPSRAALAQLGISPDAVQSMMDNPEALKN